MKINNNSLAKSLIIIGIPASIIFASCAQSNEKESIESPISMLKNTESQSAGSYAEDEMTVSDSFSNVGTASNMWSNNKISVNKDKKEGQLSNDVYKPMITGKLNDTDHVFMRTADMRCKVENVRNATFSIESIVRKYDGFVTHTNLSGTQYLSNSMRISKDSLFETYRTNVYNEIVLRVPNENLDSALIEINGLISFIDHRTIDAENVKLKLLAQQLMARRKAEHIKNLNTAVTTKTQKLPNTVDALDAIDNNKELRDNEVISNLELKDKIEYSTVSMYVYQPEVTEYKTSFIPVTPEPYTPSFSDKMADAGKASLGLFQYLIMFFVVIWPFIVVFLGVWLLIRWMIRIRLFAKLFRI